MRTNRTYPFACALAAAALLALAASASAQTTFSGVGGTISSGGAINAMNAFTAAIGGANNGSTSPQSNGFRAINWDGVMLDGTDFGGDTAVIDLDTTVAIPVDRFSARAARFFQVYAVSGDGFATVNPSMAGQLDAFSPSNTLAAFNDNQIEMSYVLAGTTQPARSRAFGAIFSDVELANTSSIEYFDDGVSLGKFFVPTGTSGQPEFLGVLFASAAITDVLLTVGTNPLFFSDGVTFSSGGAENLVGGDDLAAVDDFVYAEPVPEPEQMAFFADGSLLLLALRRRARTS